MQPIRSVAVISCYLPTPLKPRLFHFIKALASCVDVHLIYADEPPPIAQPKGFRQRARAELQSLGVTLHYVGVPWPAALLHAAGHMILGRSIHGALYSHPQMAAQVSALCDRLAPDVIHIDRLRAVPLARKASRPQIVDLVDPTFVAAEWRTQHSPRWQRPLLRFVRDRTVSGDEAAVAAAFPVIFASPFGAEQFRARFPSTRCCYIPHPIAPPSFPVRSSLLESGKLHLCFVGSLDYWPNVHGLINFLSTTWPQVRRCLGMVTLTVIGRTPSRKLRGAVARSGARMLPNPDDVFAAMQKADLAIAPLDFCGGYPNKITDALVGAGLPVLASSQAQRGLPEAVRRALPAADSPGEWSKLLTQFQSHPEPWWDAVHEVRRFLAIELNAGTCAEALLDAYASARHPQGPTEGEPTNAVGSGERVVWSTGGAAPPGRRRG